jgi:hypothetical protein
MLCDEPVLSRPQRQEDAPDAREDGTQGNSYQCQSDDDVRGKGGTTQRLLARHGTERGRPRSSEVVLALVPSQHQRCCCEKSASFRGKLLLTDF